MLFRSVRSPLMSPVSPPNAPAVEVTITCAFVAARGGVIAFWMFGEPPPGADWYDSSATIRPPSCRHRALKAWTTFLK